MKNVEIYQISFDQFEAMVGDMQGRDVLLSAAKLASEIITGIYSGEVLGWIGLVPPTLISDQAYVWMMTTPAGDTHPILLARYAEGFVLTALMKYRVIYGHCFNPKSARWLRSLGAVFISDTQFEIRRG